MTCDYTVERAAANLPQSTQSALFTVSGGQLKWTLVYRPLDSGAMVVAA